jgi:hypothetical protein
MSSAESERSSRRYNRSRQKSLREWRLSLCATDPDTGRRVQTHQRTPHGTEGGYTNWGCCCEFVPGTEQRFWYPERSPIPPEQLFWPRPGCGEVGPEASRVRGEQTRMNAPTRVLPVIVPKIRNAAAPNNACPRSDAEPQPNPNGRHHAEPGDPTPDVPPHVLKGARRHARHA